MAHWQRTLDLQPEWRAALDGDLSPQDMAKIIGERLSKLRPFGIPHVDEWRDELTDQFSDLATDDDADAEDFDGIMGELYDWADTKISGGFFDAKKVCWIKTNF